MTLFEVFRLLEDGEKLIKAETGKGGSSGERIPNMPLSTSEKRKLIAQAKLRGIKLPRKGL